MSRLLTILACGAVLMAIGCAGAPRQSAPKIAPAPTGAAAAKPGAKPKDAAPAPAAKGGDAGKSVVDDEGWGAPAEVRVADPLQPMNRAFFSFNHGLYTVVIKPVSKAYKFIFPEIVRRGIRNAYQNVKFPVRLVNHTLQGRFDRAAKETGKFVVNTTVGVAGLMTPSDKIPALADVPSADTGQTFAKWKIPHGCYLVLPVLGPSSARDAVGVVGDTALNPVSWVGIIFGGAAWTFAITAPETAHAMPDRMDRYDAITKDALDRYVASRTAYIQYREAAAKR